MASAGCFSWLFPPLLNKEEIHSNNMGFFFGSVYFFGLLESKPNRKYWFLETNPFLIHGASRISGRVCSVLRHSASVLPPITGRMSRQPEVLWAQRSEKLYLTVSLPDAKDISVKLEPRGFFTFSARGVQGETFDFSLELFGSILPDGCKTKVGLRNILCSIQKEQKGWWKRLLKSEEKPAPYIKVDWNKWCDEDDEESYSDLASDDDATHAGQDDESSDDEGMLYLPDLEKARGSLQS